MTAYRRLEALENGHIISTFDCGSDAQTLWLRDRALHAQRADTARVYVICRSGTREVVGYYALAAGSIRPEDAPERVTKGTGRYPVPVIVLTRLGVDARDQGKGLGSELVRDALIQVASVAEQVGVRALLISAETPDAAAFYRGISAAFEESPADPLQLVLLIKDLRKTIASISGVSPGHRGPGAQRTGSRSDAK